LSAPLPWISHFAAIKGFRYEPDADERWLRVWEPFATLKVPIRYDHALSATGAIGSISRIASAPPAERNERSCGLDCHRPRHAHLGAICGHERPPTDFWRAARSGAISASERRRPLFRRRFCNLWRDSSFGKRGPHAKPQEAPYGVANALARRGSSRRVCALRFATSARSRRSRLARGRDYSLWCKSHQGLA
jgi:hypothetical protein